jgi:hypothetical protein
LHITFTLLFKIKASTPFECKYQIVSATFSIFVDVGEDLVTTYDVGMPLNLPVAPVEKEEFE